MAGPFPHALHLVALVFAAMALLGCAFALFAGVRAGGLTRSATPDPGGGAGGAVRPEAASAPALPRTVLLKPLHGAEPRLGANLASALAQSGAGELALWMGVHREDDGAVAAARALAAADARARLVIDPQRRGRNAKIGNVMNLWDAATAQGPAPADALVVLSDSDISHPPGWLAAVAEALERPGAGLATCLYHGVAAAPGGWARLAAMGVSYGFLPQGLVGVALGARPAMGSTLALRAGALEALGGFAAVKDVLADDYELGRAVRRLGLEVVCADAVVGHDSVEASFGELWRHEVRWARTIRGLDPAGFAGSVVTHAVPLALMATLFSGLAPWALAVLAAAFGCRLWLKRRIDALAGRAAGPWWLLPVRDMLSLGVFAAAWFARRVDWRGSRFHVGRDGELEPL